MKRTYLILALLIGFTPVFSQQVLTLENCRQMALSHNKNLQISKETLKSAQKLKKSAFAQFLPNISANLAYTWNEKNISMLSEDAHLPVGMAGSDGSVGVGITPTSVPTFNPDGTFSFKESAINNNFTLINGKPVPLDSQGKPFDPSKNPDKLLWKNYAILPKDAMSFDAQNIFAGTLTLVQPIFMGGKIIELNNIAKYNENIALAKQSSMSVDIIVEVDEAYWRIISVENKLNLAREYRNMLTVLDNNVSELIQAGMATKADALKVKVKLNEAEIALTKAENGLRLSKMALNQLCGLPLNEEISLADQNLGESFTPNIVNESKIDNRPEILMLTQLQNVAKSNEKIMASRFLPMVGLTANYLLTNPNMYNGFQKKFDGMFNVGVVATVPIYHFGDKRHTLKSARSQSKIASLQLEEAKEKISLQIQQLSFKETESIKKEFATRQNIEQAEENLRFANEGFKEGVITSSDLLAAQIAWLSASSENIDAKIEVKLNDIYLKRACGALEIPE